MEKLKKYFTNYNDVIDWNIIILLENYKLIDDKNIYPYDTPSNENEIDFLLKVKNIFKTIGLNKLDKNLEQTPNYILFEDCFESHIQLREKGFIKDYYEYDEFISLLLRVRKEFLNQIKPTIVYSQEEEELTFEYLKILNSHFLLAKDEFKFIEIYSRGYFIMCEYSKLWLSQITPQKLLDTCIDLNKIMLDNDSDINHIANLIHSEYYRIELKYFYMDIYHRELDFIEFKTKIESLIHSLKTLLYKDIISNQTNNKIK